MPVAATAKCNEFRDVESRTLDHLLTVPAAAGSTFFFRGSGSWTAPIVDAALAMQSGGAVVEISRTYVEISNTDEPTITVAGEIELTVKCTTHQANTLRRKVDFAVLRRGVEVTF